MKIRIWGTRGSLPCPLKPWEVEEKICQAILRLPAIDTKDEQAVRAYVRGLPPLVRGTAGGNSPCVEIVTGEAPLVVDAGSGLHELGLELLKGPFGRGEGTLHLFITHPHWDHIQGFPMFRPAFVPGNRIFVYGVHDLRTVLEQQQHPLFWPISLSQMRAQIEFVPLGVGEPFSVGRVRVNTIRSHHPGDSYSYRFEDQHSTVVYACDAEYQQLDEASLQPYIDFFGNADAVIFDAQYTLREAWQKVDWGHSSALIGVDMARAARVKKLVLFHHDPTYSDGELQEIQSKAMAYQVQDPTRPICEVIVAYEGLMLDLTPIGAVDLHFTPDGEAVILTPLHTFDQHGADQLARQLARGVEQAPSSIIDLSQIETLTTAGLQALVALRREREGLPMVLAGPSDSVRQVIEISGYQDYFAIYPSVEAALAAVHAREALNLPGQVIGGCYQIEDRIGESRLGTVLKARSICTDEVVALKVLSPALSHQTLDRFMRQASQVILLDHPNIAQLFACDQDQAHTFLVEEFVAAQTLQGLLEAGETVPGRPLLPTDQAMDIAQDIARGLEYAHSRGVVHGDLKPQNVFLVDGRAKLSGFGQGRLEEGRNLLEAPLLFLSAPYLAPEQILGQALDARTDLYALGVILYQLLTAQLPFSGTDREVLQAHLEQELPAPRELNHQLSPSLEHLVLKLLARNPNERYASAQQVQRIFGSLTVRAEEASYPRRRLLVGREEQLLALKACWEEAQAGQGQLIFITGESGIGKTSLAQEAAARSGAPVRLIGQCHEREGSPAYYLFSQVLESYFATVPPEFYDEQARHLCANLTRLVPQLRRMLPDLQGSSPLGPEQEQLRLMSSLTQFVRQATQERPWLLILEDLQWADVSSLELLRYLGRHLPSMALLVIGTYRDVELQRGHPLLRTLHDLSRHPTYRHLPLDRLDQSGVGYLLANIWQSGVPIPLVEKIYLHTEGNPFYVEEVAKGLEDDGLVTLQAGRWQFAPLEEVRLPQSVREAVWKRIGALSPDTQAVLSQAAVLGETFQFRILWELSGLPERQILEHLDMALERQLVQEVPGDTLIRFRHPAIRQILYADLGPLRRRMLHRQAGEVLERQAMPEPERIAEELAHHFREAGETDRTLTYSLTAARQAQAAYANEAAVMWYRRTLEMLDQLGPEQDDQEIRLSAYQALGEVLILVGRNDEALEHCAAAQELLEAQALTPERARQMASIYHQMAEVCERRGDYDLALTWLEKALHDLDENELTVELVRLYNLSGWVRRHQGHYEVALAWLERALLLAQAAGLRQVEADSLRRLGAVTHYLGQSQQYYDYSKQALEICREIGDRRGEGAALNNMGISAVTQGSYAEARAYQEQALEIWREIGDRGAESASLNNLGQLAIFLGDYARARLYYEQSLDICREIGDRRGQARALSSLGTVAGGRGDYTAAAALYEEGLEIRREIGDLRGEGETINYLGALARSLGDYAGARAYYDQALLIHHEIGDRLGQILELCDMGMLFHQQGFDEVACEYCQEALELAQDLGDRHFEACALTHLGHALVGLGRLAEAADAYKQAIALREEIGEHHLAVESVAGLARVSLAWDDLEVALAQVEEILQHLQSGTLDGVEEPFRVYLTCYQVLSTAQDPRAREVLAAAYRQLQEQAIGIADEQVRRSFLEGVTSHREIVAEADRIGVASGSVHEG